MIVVNLWDIVAFLISLALAICMLIQYILFKIKEKRKKMTPEQKAFYECGKSVESVRETIQKIRQHAIHEFGEPYYLLMPSEKGS